MSIDRITPSGTSLDSGARRLDPFAGDPLRDGQALANTLVALPPQQRDLTLALLGEQYGSLGVADRQWLARGVADAFPPLQDANGLAREVLQPLQALGYPDAALAVQQESAFLFGIAGDPAAAATPGAPPDGLVSFVQPGTTAAVTPGPAAEPAMLASARSDAARQREMLLDLVQLGLGLAGIADPTGIADGADAIISFGRGDWLGGVISGVSILPYIGDLAKAGKLGKWTQTVVDAVELAGKNADFARQLRPVLRQIDRVLDQIPIDRLPGPVRESLERIRARIDDFFAGAGLEAGVGWRQRGEAPEAWNTTTRADGSINDCNWCSLEIVTGMPRENLASATARIGIEPGQRMSPAELGKALKNLGLIDDTKAIISGSKDAVLGRMMEAPVGTYFALSMSNAGRGGHTVVARRTAGGVEILDGQVNTVYDAAKVAGMQTWDAFRLNGVRNPNL